MLIKTEEKRERERSDLERKKREKEKQEKEAWDREKRRRQQAGYFRCDENVYSRWKDPYGIPPQSNPKDKRHSPAPIPWDVIFRIGEAKRRR